MDDKQKTLVEDLIEYAAHSPEETPYIFFSKQADKALTSKTLDETARAIASDVLQHTTVKARVILLYPAGLEFVTALFGCFYAEVIAVPVYTHNFDPVKLLPWLKAIVDDTEASAILTLRDIVTLKESWVKDAPWLNEVLWVATDEIVVSEKICWEPQRICSDAIALLQYSSGSTGMPKGVMVTHKNLMSNVAIIREAFGLHPGQKVVSWLPHYHDMGLIGNILCSVFSRTELHFCSPLDFVRTPLVWLQRITKTKASVSGGPNFAYDLCSRYIRARDYTTLDLSHWKIAYNGAEAVRDETLKQFERIFSPYGFKKDVFTPCYGLAESTLMVTSTPKQEVAQTQIVNREAFRLHQIEKTKEESAASQVLVSSGVVQPTVRVEVVNPKTRLICNEGEVGEIWVLSPSVCAGYWNQPQLSNETFKATLNNDDKSLFLRTGDLGAFSDGYLYVTGRIKDLIIIRGQNHAPEDIESTVVGAHPLLKNTRAVALGITEHAEEQLVILVTEPKGADDVQDDIVQAIDQQVSIKHDVRVHDIQFVRRGRIPVTSSGKIRRGECKQKWIEGQFSSAKRPLILNGSVPVIKDINKRCALILEQLQALLARELNIPLIKIDAHISLRSIVLDSLSKIRIQHDIQRLTGIQIDVTRFEKNISLLQFSQALSDELSQVSLQNNLPELKTKYRATYPLSSGQKALFFMQELMHEKSAYYISRTIKITSSLNIPILKIAFNQLLEHHVALRTQFFMQDGVPMQSIVEGITPAFEVVDACTWSHEALMTSLKQAANLPFDLDSGLMARMILFKRTDGCVLFLSVHHIVSDLLSLTTLVKALLAYYVAELHENTATLTKPSVFPEAYVAYEANFLQSTQATVMREYWLNELSGSIEPLHLPIDKVRPHIKTYQGKSLTHQMPKALSERVIAFANARQVTPYVVLMSAYIVLLHRYTHQTNILVGSPMANRSDARFAELISYLVNPVVIRAQCAKNTTFLALIDEVSTKIKNASKYQAYPFSELVEALKVERDASRTPIFQVMMSYLNPNPQYDLSAFALNQTGSAFHTEALTFEPQVIEHGGAQFDLNVGMAIVNGCVASTWEYSTDLFFEDTIQQMSSHFQMIMETMITSPESSVGAFPLVNQIKSVQTEVMYDLAQPIHALFETQAQKTPHQIAVLDAERTFTYEALNQKSNQLAHKLCRQGVLPNTLVALQLERSIEMVIAIYAVLKTGAAYLPIAPDAPAAYVSDILTEASPRLVLNDINLVALSNESTANLEVVITPEMPAYVIYTSGSTGKPKGVVIPHRGIRNRILWMQDTFHLKADDRVLQKTPYTFDVSLWEFFWPLGFGASLYLSRPEGHKDSDYLVDIITEHAITVMHFVPSMLSMFLMHDKVDKCKGLKQVFCSGEALRVALAKDFLERLPAALHNLYGPTEASVDVTYWTCPREEAFDIVPIGYAIANTELYILDEFMQAVPRGVSGELYIGGYSLANAYLNREALTKERFVYDAQGNRLYKTGDLCRYLPDGTIAYLGRIDNQVKVRGFRIELEAVEAAVASYPDIEQAVACVITAENYQTRLGVYYVLKDGDILDLSLLKAYLNERLLDYMVPSVYMKLDTLPLLPNGKANRKALPDPKSYLEAGSVHKKTTYVAPKTKTERLLCAVYEKVLNVKQVGILDNFFDLGGDSILALQAVAILREKGLIVTVQALYSNATIQSVGASIALGAEAQKPPSKALESFEQVLAVDKLKLPEGLQNAYPLSNMQEGLVFHSEFSPDYEIYVMGLHVALCLDEVCLEKALELLSLRHALLRTSFDHLSYSEPLQLVHPSVKIPTRIIDIQALSNTQQDEAVEQYMREEKWRKFDWSKAPFLRLIIHKRSATSNQFTFCHPLFDGWSMGLLITEFFTIYGALLKGNVPPLNAPEKLAYQDFIVLEREAMQAKATKAYWSQTLAGIERSTLPRWPEYRNSTVGMHERMTVSVENDVLLGLQALARKADVPLKSVLLAAHMRVVSLLTGQQDVTTGLLVNGRPEQTGGDKIAGMFLNTAPFRVDFSAITDEHWVALVRAVFEAERQMLPHRRFPLAKLVHLFGKGKPFFETAFNYIHFHIYKTLEKVPDLSVLGWKSPSDQTYFPLTAYFHLDISQMSSELLFFLDVDTGVLDKAQMKRLPGYYLNTLKAMVSAEQTNYHTPKLLSLDERRLLFDTFNPVQQKSDTSHMLVHTRFEVQAEQYGESKPAVTLCDTQEEQVLTYGLLNARANQLTHYLIQLGVGPNVLVGVCLERSLDLMVALLGILKAGGAYVPLDPLYPEERLAFMLKDSEASIVVSTSACQLALPKSEHFKIVCLDNDCALINKQSTANLILEQPVGIENLAYVIYTSGTTGQPKGVEVPHRALANLLVAMADELAWSSTDGLLAVTTVSFDIAGLELYLPLVTGAQLFLASREVTLNGEALMEQLSLPHVTTMQATPSTWRLLIRAGWTGRVDFKALCGGEYMPYILAKDLLNRGCMLWNVYGPTETTIWSLVHRVSALDDAAIPIGRPIRNTQCYVLDAFKQPVPLGTSGELYISGDGLAHGYRHQKELTKEKFCMWAEEASQTKQRLYRTGDLVRFRPDGLLEYMGRVDKQVKVRGFRVELGEIESHLESLDNIEKTIARTWTDEKKDASLVAYIVMKTGKKEYTQSFLRTFLSKKLPMHMLPSAFVTLKELPLMLNGKVDHQALPLPTLTKSSETTYVAPVSALEKQIITIYEEVLSIPHIGIDDNFFDMGGHSLLLVTVHRRLQIVLDKKISIVTLFEHATVRKLAAFFDVVPETLDIAVEQRGKRKEWLKKQRKRRTVLEPV